jgi:hypothetical protein
VTFEECFFGPGNRLRWDAIQAGTLPRDLKERLGPFLDDLRRNTDVNILPRVHDDGRVQWYALCSSARVARRVRDELRAFLGPSYSDFEGQPTHLNRKDTVEEAVLDRAGSNAIRLEVPNPALFDIARQRLLLSMRLRGERPVRHSLLLRAVGRVLRDFEFAILAQDGEAALECIAELRSTGRLGATNFLFLEVRRLAALQQWAAILALPELDSLLVMNRPRRVTEALIRAVYNVRLVEFEARNLAAVAAERFRIDIFPRYRNIYKSRAGLSGYEIDASFMMVAVTSDPPHREIAEAIFASYITTEPQRNYLAAISALLPVAFTPPVVDALLEARSAFAEADVDRAYELTVSLPPSFDRCALLLRCARDMGTLTAAKTALDAVDALSATDRKRLPIHAVLRPIYESLAALAVSPVTPSVPVAVAEEVPASWPSWLRRLGRQERWQSAVAVAEAGAREWNVEALAADTVAVSEIAELLISDRPEWGQTALHDALPHLLEFFLSQRAHIRFKSIYENLFLAIALDDHVSIPQFAALLRVTEARLELGVTVSEYREIVEELLSAVERVGSPSVADVALESVDVLVNAACPDPIQRQNFVIRVAAFFQRWFRRIDPAQWALLRCLGEELGVPDASWSSPGEDETTAPPDEWRALDGKRIALYSLRESALRRTEAILRGMCSSVQVQIFNDLVGGSPALRTAAVTADIFVLTTAAAKHAATLYIESNRPKSRVTLYARGQGSASALAAIREYVGNIENL